jgi:omega-6 fatty acid desaturase (delta-12 desaturase)
LDLPLSWKREWASVLLNDLMLLLIGGAGAGALALGWRTVTGAASEARSML